MMKQNNFTQQTHFIGVLLPEDITLTQEDCRRYMKEAYGCKSGHGTVANRDVPAGVMTKALQVMNELKLVEDFPVDNITIFERRGSSWDAAVKLELGGTK